MKYFRFCVNAVLPVSLCLCLCMGCGGEKPKTTEKVEETTATSENVSAETPVLNPSAKPAELDKAVNEHIQKVLKENPELEKAEAPIQMTYFFIRALQMDNTPAVMGMLTQDAYREMSARQGEKFPCPDFLKNSDVALGNVQYLTDDMSEENGERAGNTETTASEGNIVGARVGTIWKIKTEAGIVEENIAWVFRFEDDAWLVAGMISIVDPNYPPILFNFENLAETEAEFAARAEEVEKINAEATKKAEESENAQENAQDNAKEDGEKDETSTESAGVAVELPTSLP